jgi:hypothetical protein
MDVDVAAALASSSCQGGTGSDPDAPSRVKIELAPPKDAKAGSKVSIDVSIVNTSNTPLVLRVIAPPWSIEAKDSNGKSTNVPSNEHPCGRAAAMAAVAHGIADADPNASSGASPAQIVIAPNGRAHAKVEWEASGKKWGPQKTTSMGSCVADKLPAPLVKGDYTIKVRVPAVGVPLPEAETSIAIKSE